MQTLPNPKSLKAVLLVLALLGCGPSLTTVDQPTLDAAEAKLVDNNGLALNGLALNGLALNGLALNGLALNGLALNGLALNGVAVNGLAFATWYSNPTYGGQQPTIMKYFVRCAMPANVTVTYKGTTWQGGFGLAPGWANGAPSTADKRWVSACMLAHVNANGQPIAVSFRGASTSGQPGLAATPAELGSYPYSEAAFWGDLFSASPQRFACDGRRSIPLDLATDPTLNILTVGRSCGVSDKCGFTIPDSCALACTGSAGLAGGYTGCQGQAQVITTYRSVPFTCGDGICDPAETHTLCPHDCK